MIGLFAASAMLVSSTGAVAASAPAPQTQVSPWAVLSVMNGGAAAFQACGAAVAAAAAAQPTGGCVLPQVDVPPVVQPPAEVPPVVPVAAGGLGALGISPLILGLAALAAGIGLFLAVRNKSNGSNSPA
jgi:hypothetical protein